jgi:hypothetical protein
MLIYPIVLPELVFKDRFNNQNLYVDMNPSLHISESGIVKILVRRVNYRKFHDKTFILYQEKSNSVYTLLTGTIDKGPLNIESFKEIPLINESILQKYPTYWTGIEDIRFITDSFILATIPEYNPLGQPCIFSAHLTNTSISSSTMCSPNVIEKNWMPYIDHMGTQKVIYSLFPFVIKSIEKDDRETLTILPELEGYHGSTNGISYNNEQLFLIHINKEKTYHRWLLFNPITQKIKVSEPFVFFKHSHIEFTCSLALYKDRIFVSIGVNDNRAFILELSKDEIRIKI